MRSILKPLIFVVLMTAATAALAFAGPPVRPDEGQIKASLDKAPQAVFPQMRYEFDPVFEGTEIKHDFVVENKGQAPLVIKNIRPD